MASGKNILASSIGFGLISLVLYIVGVSTPAYILSDTTISTTNDTVLLHVESGLFRTCLSQSCYAGTCIVYEGCYDANLDPPSIRVLFVLALVNMGLGVVVQIYLIYGVPAPNLLGMRRARRRAVFFPFLSVILGIASMARAVDELSPTSAQNGNSFTNTYYGYSFGCGTAAWVFAFFSLVASFISIHTNPSPPPTDNFSSN